MDHLVHAIVFLTILVNFPSSSDGKTANAGPFKIVNGNKVTDSKLIFKSTNLDNDFYIDLDVYGGQIDFSENIDSSNAVYLKIPFGTDMNITLEDDAHRYYELKQCQCEYTFKEQGGSQVTNGCPKNGCSCEHFGREIYRSFTKSNAVYDVDIRYGVSPNTFKVQFKIQVGQQPFTYVSIVPDAIIGCNTYRLLKGSYVTLDIQNPTGPLKFVIKQASVEKVSQTLAVATFNHTFLDSGTFSLEILQSNSKIWSLSVSIEAVNLHGLIGQLNRATEKNMTLKVDQCLRYNPGSPKWAVDKQGSELVYTGPSFTHYFDKVGAKSVNANVKFIYPSQQVEIVYIQLYDRIEGLNVTLNSSAVCKGNYVNVDLSISSGSAPRLKYKTKTSAKKVLPENPFALLVNSVEESELIFYAENPISEQTLARNIQYLENTHSAIVDLPNQIYGKRGESVLIGANSISGLYCAFNYTWIINSIEIDSRTQSNPDQPPVLDYTFASEGTHAVILNIYGHDGTSLISSATTSVIIEEVISFTLPGIIEGVIGDSISINASFVSKSTKLSYKWISIGLANEIDTGWINDVTSVQSLALQITQDQPFILKLQVKNSISEMTANVTIAPKQPRNVTFKLLHQQRCFIQGQPLTWSLQVNDTYNLNEKLVCRLDQETLLDINADLPITVSIQPSQPINKGRLEMTCSLKDNPQYNQTFIFYLIDRINVSFTNDLMAGENLTGSINNPVETIPYSWYIRERDSLSSDWTKIAENVIIEHLITKPGLYEVRVVIDDDLEAIDCSVVEQFTVNIPLVLKINGKIVQSGSHHFVGTNTELNFSAAVNLETEEQYYMTWTDSTVRYPVDKGFGRDRYNFYTFKQGTIKVQVSAEFNNVTASAFVFVWVQLEVTGVKFSSEYGNHSTEIENVIKSQESFALTVKPIPADAALVTGILTCHSLKNLTFYQKNQTLDNPYQIPLQWPSGENIFGEVSCKLVIGNYISQLTRHITFFINPGNAPVLRILDILTYTNNKPNIQVEVINNTLPSSLSWFYGHIRLSQCSNTVPPSMSNQIFSCTVELNNSAARLLVKVESENKKGYTTDTILYSIRSASISPSIIQVGHPTNISLFINVSDVDIDFRFKENRSTSRQISIQEPQIGTYSINITLKNRITLYQLHEPIQVIDASNFALTSNQDGTIYADNIQVVNGAQIEFMINNFNPNVHYVIKVDDVILPALNLPTFSHSFSHNVSSSKPIILSIEASINGVLIKDRQYRVICIAPVKNASIELPTNFIHLNSRYSFNVTFSGQNGNCYISQFKQSDCINPYKDVTGFEIEPYETYCTINFHTESTHKCYNITIEVGNMAGVNTVHWFYEPFHQVPLVIESVKHVQKGQISHASIKNPIPNTKYIWYLISPSDPSSYNVTLGESPAINFTIPDDLKFGEYQIQVKSIYNNQIFMTKTVVSSILILPNTSNTLNSTLNVHRAKENNFILIELDVTNYYAGLDYRWSICRKSDISEDCSGPSKHIGINKTLSYPFPKNSSEGVYLFTVIGTGTDTQNPLITEQIRYSHCKLDNLTITPSEMKNATERYRNHVMSKWYYSEIEIPTKCPVKYKWSFHCKGLGHRTCNDAELIQPELLKGMQFIDNRPVLELPPRAFKVGTYFMYITLVVGKYFPTSYNYRVYLTVTYSPLVPVISGGSFRVIGDENEAYLDATGTIDPDANFGTVGDITYKWNVSDQHCYVNLRNSSIPVNEWSPEHGKLRIKPQCLSPSLNKRDGYWHEVEVKRIGQSRVEKTSQQIVVVDGAAPLVEINCLTCQAYKTFKYIRTKDIKMSADCTNCQAVDVTYSWSIEGVDNGKRIVLDETTVKSPLQSKVLLLRENVLDGKQSYKVTVEARVKGWNAVGSTILELQKNKSPSGGECTFTPDQGEALTTSFEMSCKGWTDEDNKEQPLLYWLVVGEEETNFFRGIQTQIQELLPVGDGDDYTLPVQIWVQDSLGVYTIALNKTVRVVPPSIEPSLFIQKSVIPSLQKLAKEKNLHKVTSLVVSSSKILANSKESKNDILKQLIDGASKVDPTSIENIAQVLDAFHAVQKSSKPSDIEIDSRKTIQNSLYKMMNLSKSFAAQLISLESKSQNAFMDLVSSNIAYGLLAGKTERHLRDTVTLNEVENPTQFENENLDLLDQLYFLILNTTIIGEKARLLDTPYIKTALQRLNGGATVQGSRQVGSCTVSYDLKNMADLIEVAECSSLNPYSQIEGQTSVTSLTFADDKNEKLKLRNVEVDIGIPIENVIETPLAENDEILNKTFIIQADDLIVFKLENFTEPSEGWASSALYVLIDVLDDFTFVNEDVSLYSQLAFNEMPTASRRTGYLKKTFKPTSDENERTIMLQGSDYQTALANNQSYYFGLDQDGSSNFTVNITIYITTCRFWNTSTSRWEGFGCKPSPKTTLHLAVCSCNHLTSFGSSINIAPNKLDFTVLKKLDVENNPVMLATCIAIFFVYLILLLVAFNKDSKEAQVQHIIPFIGSEDGFFQYEVRIKTGAYPWAGTSANVGIQVLGTKCTSKARILQGDNPFQRNGLDIFRISLDRSIGKIRKIKIWHDNTGSDPSWYLERVIIRSMVSGEKFFFYCNKWIGVDCEDEKLEHEFHVADIEEMRKFSTIFYDVIGRSFNDYHLWLSIFEKPKFSKFTRVQRLTCLVTLVFSWMAVNAAWFRVAPNDEVDIYIGFKGYSFEELIIGAITALIVFPLNLLFLLLFRKSRQKQVETKSLKIWKEPKRVMLESVDIDTTPLLDNRNHHGTNKSSESLDGDFSSLKRTKKQLRFFDNLNFLEDDDSSAEEAKEAIESDEPTASGKQKMKKINFSNDEDIIRLPRSFALPAKSLRLNVEPPLSAPSYQSHLPPPPEYRSSSLSYPSLNEFYAGATSSTKQAIKKTHSDGSFGGLIPSPSDEENVEILHPLEELPQQENKPFFDAMENFEDLAYADFFGRSTRESSTEARLSAQIKKNEELMVHLQIPNVVELDPQTRWTLPHWCKYIGFMCCFLISAFSIVIVITYGQQFGYHTSIKWLKCLVFGFLEDFFLTFPFLLVFIAAFMALFIKPYDLDKVDHHDFFICPSGTPQPPNKDRITPPTGTVLKDAISVGKQMRQGRKYRRDLLLQLLLLWLVVSLYFVFHTPKHQELMFKDRVRNELVPKFKSQNFHAEYFDWLEKVYIPYLYDANDTWHMIDVPRTKQYRVAGPSCPFEDYRSVLCKDSILTRFPKTRDLVLPHPLNSNAKSEAKAMSDELRDEVWLIPEARSIKNNFKKTNPAMQLSAYYDLSIYMERSGYTHAQLEINVVPYKDDITNLKGFGYFCMALLSVVLFILGYRALIKLIVNWRWIFDIWFLNRVLFILVTIAGLVLHIYEIITLDNHDNVVQLDYVTKHELAKHCFGVSMFLLLIRCVRLMSLSRVYKLMRKMLKRAQGLLFSVAGLHIVVVIGFTNVGYLLFGAQLDGYRSYAESFLFTFLFRWWQPGGGQLRDITNVAGVHLGMLWVILYTAYWYILAMNMFRMVLLNEWSDAKSKKMISSWKDIWTGYFRSKGKKRKQVRFAVTDSSTNDPAVYYYVNNSSSNSKSSIEEIEIIEKPDKIEEVKPKYNLPKLPYSNFELESNLISVLADLDRMITAENWEEESLSKVEKELNIMRQNVQKGKQTKQLKRGNSKGNYKLT
ncbi:uncharacterized protein [Clytia hemisphaerica]|uniref:Uncharacterized protein n=1 Tax=Clytia hemisphaerica TaxID=252671 RepID=A0A7M5VE18_9CNID